MSIQQKEFYVCPLSAFSVDIHRSLCRKENLDDCYGFIGFSLDELAILAKKKKDGVTALSAKLKPVTDVIVRRYMKRIHCLAYLVDAKVEECLDIAVRKYDPTRGPFLNLFLVVCKKGLDRFARDFESRKRKVVPYVPEHPRAQGDILFSDSVPSSEERQRFEIDFARYRERLSLRERKILRMFDDQCTLREISRRVSLSPSSVSNKIRQMVAELRNCARNKQI